MQADGECAAAGQRASGIMPSHKAASWDGAARSRSHPAPEEQAGGSQQAYLLSGGAGGALERGGAIVMSIFPTIRGRVQIFRRAVVPEEGDSPRGEGVEGEWDPSATSAAVEHGEGPEAPRRASTRPPASLARDSARASVEAAPKAATTSSLSCQTAPTKEHVRLPAAESVADNRAPARIASGGAREAAAPKVPSFRQFLEDQAEDCALQMPALKLACRRLNESLELSASMPAPEEAPSGIMKLFEGADLPCSPERYMLRMVKYGETSPCNVVVALIYLNRLRSQHPMLALTPSNAQRLMLVAVMTATKFLDDEHYSNKYWAKIGELSLKEMNRLELAFLTMLDMSCQVLRDEYDAFVDTMSHRDYVFLNRAPSPCRRGSKRNPSLSPVSSVYDFPGQGREVVSPLFRTTTLSDV